MHDRASLLAPGLVTLDAHLEAEFEALLVETSRLVFRVAFSVLRHQQDAEDVAHSMNTLVLRDGQARQFSAATDRVNGEVVRIEVTLRVVK